MLKKSQSMTKLLLTGAAATAIAAAPMVGAVVTGTTATALADPVNCVDATGVGCTVTAPGVEGTAGPEGVTGTAPGVEGTAGPEGVSGCVDAIGCLGIPMP